MRIVEIRRHAERDGDEDLTPRGLATAAKARESLDFPYHAPYVSPRKRARLTMEAFGIHDAVVEARIDERPRPPFLPFETRWRALIDTGLDAVTAWFSIPEAIPVLLESGARALEGVREIAAKLPERGRALAVSHGGTIEPLAVVATGRPYAQLFGTAELGYCEGVKACFHGEELDRLDVIRLRV